MGASVCRLPTYSSAGQAGGIRSEPKRASGTRSSSRVQSLFYLATGLGWIGRGRPPAWLPLFYRAVGLGPDLFDSHRMIGKNLVFRRCGQIYLHRAWGGRSTNSRRHCSMRQHGRPTIGPLFSRLPAIRSGIAQKFHRWLLNSPFSVEGDAGDAGRRFATADPLAERAGYVARLLRKREGDREVAARCRKRLLGASFCRLPTYTSAGQAGGIRPEPKRASGTRSSLPRSYLGSISRLAWDGSGTREMTACGRFDVMLASFPPRSGLAPVAR